MEMPNNDSIAFLDTVVRINNGQVSFELYIKPTHSGTCVPFDAYVPKSRKKCLIISEVIRTQKISSEELKSKSMEKVMNRLLANGYPRSFVSHVINHTRIQPLDKTEPITYIRIPYNSERQRFQISQLCRATGLNNKLRLIYITAKSFAWQFRGERDTMTCPANCSACRTAFMKGKCFSKFVVYQIICDLCGAFYVGQTERTIRTRIHEHITSKLSHVYLHMMSHSGSTVEGFKWRIIATERCNKTRLAMEAMFIHKNSVNIMNGCEGKYILPYLLPQNNLRK
jgi:hypothetical protein